MRGKDLKYWLQSQAPEHELECDRRFASESGEMWSLEFRHESNSLTEGGNLNKGTWQHSKTRLDDQITIHAKSAIKVLRRQSNNNC